jgi:hypothetical protein
MKIWIKQKPCNLAFFYYLSVMEEKPLSNPDVFPTPEVLESILAETYHTLKELLDVAGSDSYLLNPEWRYYKDGKSWLCKITHKKKTVAWLSIWSDHFKVAFYFTKKTGGGIPSLEIDEIIKENYLNHEPVGKLKPLVIETRLGSQLGDILQVMRYKMDQL